jgi:OFA family oxalate/formate antiporter-like MFS transporter
MIIIENIRHGQRIIDRAIKGSGYRWSIVILSSLCISITFGVTYSFSVFYSPLKETLQVSAETISLLFSGNVFLLYAVAMGGGFLADRCSPRTLMAVSTLCWCGGLLGTASANSYLEMVALYGLVSAVGCGICYVTVYATVARWFYERRGLALGILSMGFGLGTLVFPPISQELIGRFSWRTTYLVFGILSLVVLLGTTLVIRNPPSAGKCGEEAERLRSNSITDGGPLSVTASLTSVRFWLVAGGFMFGFYTFYTFLVHLVPYATDLGISTTVTSTAIGLIGGASIFTRIGGAYLSDHIGRVPVLAGSLSLLSLCSLGMLFLVTDTISILVMATLFGFGYGSTAALFSPIIVDMFGTTSVGRMLGLTSMSFGIAGLTGPYITSVLFTATETYYVPFLVASVTPIIGVACIVASARIIGPISIS